MSYTYTNNLLTHIRNYILFNELNIDVLNWQAGTNKFDKLINFIRPIADVLKYKVYLIILI